MATRLGKSASTGTGRDYTSILSSVLLPEQTQQLAPLLAELRADDPAFEKSVQVGRYDAGSVVAEAKDLANWMYLLIEGTVNLLCTKDNRRRLVAATLEPGAVFGQGALENPIDSTVYAEAVGPATVWMIPAQEARSMLVRYPILGWGLLQTYGQRLMQMEDNLENIAYKKLPERLAALLWELADPATGVIDGRSHQALADHLGTYRETVSAVLRDFKRSGFITLGYRHIEVLDMEAIKEIGGVWEW